MLISTATDTAPTVHNVRSAIAFSTGRFATGIAKF